MKVTRKSQASGETRTMDLDITQQQLIDYEKGMKIQYAFPNLTTSEREFFMTGITEEEWNAMFPDDEN
jgi:7,8-dihydro-6-hydroxymethylpterin-pyrophosphokinase